MGKGVQSILGTAGGFLLARGAEAFAGGAVNEIKTVFNAASDLNETVNKIGAVFKTTGGDVLNWGQDAAQNLGMSRQAALEATGTFGNLFQTMGLGEKPAADMSEHVVKLGADLASFNNIDPAQVIQDLQSGLTGQMEPMRKYGVDVSDAAIQQEALAEGITTSTQNMSQAEKVQLRYNLIIKQTGTAQGDFAKTSGAAANATRIFHAHVSDLEATIGKHFYPAATAGIVALNGMFDSSTKVGGAISGLISGNLVPLAGTLSEKVGGAVKRVTGLFDYFHNGSVTPLGKSLEAFGITAEKTGGKMGKMEAIVATLGKVWGEWAPAIGQAAIDLGEIAVTGALHLAGDLAGNIWDWVKDHWVLVAAEIAFGPVGVAAALFLSSDLPSNLWEWFKDQLGLGGDPAIPKGHGWGSLEGREPISFGNVAVTAGLVLGGKLAEVAGDIWGWVKGQLGIGANVGDGTGGPDSGQAVPLGDVAVTIGGWIISGAADIGGDIVRFLAATSVTLAKVVVDVGGWLISEAVDIAPDIVRFLAATSVSLARVTVGIGGWLVDSAADIGLDIVRFLAATSVDLAKVAVNVGGWLVSEAADIAPDIVRFLAATSVDLARVTVSVGGWLVDSATDIGPAIVRFLAATSVDLAAVAVGIKSWVVSVSGADISGFIQTALDGVVGDGTLKSWVLRLNDPTRVDHPDTSAAATKSVNETSTTAELAKWALLLSGKPDTTANQTEVENSINSVLSGQAIKANLPSGWQIVAGTPILGPITGLPDALNKALLGLEPVRAMLATWNLDLPAPTLPTGNPVVDLGQQIAQKIGQVDVPLPSWSISLPTPDVSLGGLFGGLIDFGTLLAAKIVGAVGVVDVTLGAWKLDLPTPDIATFAGDVDGWIDDKINGFGDLLGTIVSWNLDLPTPSFPDLSVGDVVGWITDAISGLGDIKVPMPSFSFSNPLSGMKPFSNPMGAAKDPLVPTTGVDGVGSPGGSGGQASALEQTMKITADNSDVVAKVADSVALIHGFDSQTAIAKLNADNSGAGLQFEGAMAYGAAWNAAAFTAHYNGDNSGAGMQFEGAMSYGQAWQASSWTGLFLGDNSGAGMQFEGAQSYGIAWGASTFTGIFAGDNGPAAIAYTDAMTWGGIWDAAVFTAEMDITDNATGVINGAIDALNAFDGRSVTASMTTTNTTDNIVNNLTNGPLRGRATGGTVREPVTLVGERGPELVSLPYGSQVHTAGESKAMLARKGGDTYNQTVNIITIPPDAWVQTARDAETGARFAADLPREMALRRDA